MTGRAARARFRRAVVAFTFSAALFGGLPSGAAHSTDDQVRAALGPTATKLANGLWSLTLPSGRILTTHGPDPKHDHGGGLSQGDPERVPVCATTRAQYVLYGRRNSSPDLYNSKKPSIQAAMRRINAVLAESSVQSGGPAVDYKVVCDGSGAILVGQFTSSGNDFWTIVGAAEAAGYTRSDVNYSIFYDGDLSGICGTGTFIADERAIEENWNNSGGGYAVNYADCWNDRTPMHENGHNMGAVQSSAPFSTGSGMHCNDTLDIMCYAPDGGNRNQSETLRCIDRMHFDCGYDTYFDTAVESGEWLATHWNIGSTINRFISWGASPPPPPPNQPPVPDFETSCYKEGCSFTNTSVDEWFEGLRFVWDFGDGSPTVDWDNPGHWFQGEGTYDVTLQATDYKGLVGTTTKPVTVSFADPDPATPTIAASGNKYYERVGDTGSWDYVKFGVPLGTYKLKFDMRGPVCGHFNNCNRTLDDLCVAVICGPQLDLYARVNGKPTTAKWECRGRNDTNIETCTVIGPEPGYWYIGVHAYRGGGNGQFFVQPWLDPL